MTDGRPVRLSEVRLEGVGKRYPAGWAVVNLSISVGPGEHYSLLGPASAGKTTVLRLMAGLEQPEAGRLFIDDELVNGVPAARRGAGMVFAGGALWPHLSVFDNVAFGLRSRKEPEAAVTRKVEAALERAELAGTRARRPAELTPGQRRRAALARALVVEPRLLLLDDPLHALDLSERAMLRAQLDRVRRDLGITTIHATRDPAAALAVSTRIAVLSAGALVQEGRPEEIYWRPRNRLAAALVGAANLVPVRVVELREVGVVVETDGGARLPVPAGDRRWSLGDRGLVCLRPEALRVEEAALAPGGIPGRVTAQVFEGSRLLHEVDVAGTIIRVETLTSASDMRAWNAGDRVRIEVAPESAMLLADEDGRPGPMSSSDGAMV